MSSAASYRQFLKARAGGACEYCRLVEAAAGVTFHLEHIQPRSQGGQTVLANLAFSCPGCNFAKGERIVAPDHSGQLQRLYDPRNFEPASLGWHLHFILDIITGKILPRTKTAEATVLVLDMNGDLRVGARMLQIRMGLIA
ncbi:MAG: HNH endonuclease signature motif containing protein [Pirellulaceae bacterium]